MDVNVAYLKGHLEDDVEIWMDAPEGFERFDPISGEKLYCLLKKGIYGTKQGGRCWYYTLLTFLLEQGFSALKSDPSVYIRDGFIVSVSTDDILFCGKTDSEMDAFELEMESRFKMTRQGDVVQHLGITISRDHENNALFLSQEVYLTNMLGRFGMLNSRPVDTPMSADANNLLRIYQNNRIQEQTIEEPYRQAIGCLLWAATQTRQDISAAVGILGKFVSNPQPEHWAAVKRVFRYLNGTKNYRLRLGGNTEQILLEVYTDSDWADDRDDRHSRTGVVAQINGSTIS
jgi:hypothetical protein